MSGTRVARATAINFTCAMFDSWTNWGDDESNVQEEVGTFDLPMALLVAPNSGRRGQAVTIYDIYGGAWPWQNDDAERVGPSFPLPVVLRLFRQAKYLNVDEATAYNRTVPNIRRRKSEFVVVMPCGEQRALKPKTVEEILAALEEASNA
jgi:hypothetical protein